ncbi:MULTISPECIES: aminotransferase class V-fold PLP-dependent enzyme [Saccharothrix]|uniref:aminotransferase class V-fold PLP-dependent enzyme n=1 Tax=Saccharothrix TaxID=2071 RepID=UPI00093F0D29|nr:cysteine desulfurase [Saccharothrix sp. CB00851]OKI35459.1 cysteine sulfinate desulfinase [Saccharothrix sp. CB00851]
MSQLHPGVLPATVRADFPMLRGEDAPVYLDNAATTQKPQVVLDAVVDYYRTANSNVGRGHHRLALAATDRYENARAVVGCFLGARHPEEVVFTANTTDSTNLLAEVVGRRVVGRGDQVVVSGMEHNSNLLPWRRLCDQVGARLVVAPTDPAGRVDLPAFTALMGPRVRIVAVAHVSNVLGTVNPVREMADVAHRHGALVAVDGAQAVAHLAVDVGELDADFYCFSGHKVYGPMGIGVLYGKHELLADLPPFRVGGGTVKGVRHDEPVRYVPAPARFEAGTPNVAGAVGMAAGLEYLLGLGGPAVRAHHESLVAAVLEAVADLEDVDVVGDPGAVPCGIVSLSVRGVHPYDVGGHLDANGIAVRCGVHCASTFLDSLGLVGTVRLSFAVYNTLEEIEYLRSVLKTVRPGTWTAEHPTERFL